MPNQNLSSLLRRNPQIQRLYNQAKTLQKLQAHLEKNLAHELAHHCQVAALADGVLTLYTESPAWAAKARFLTADLLKVFQNDTTLGVVNTIRVKARPPVNKPEPETAKERSRLSATTVQLLREVADNTEDPDLRRSLLRLAEN